MIIGIFDGAGNNVCFHEGSYFLGGSETWLNEIASAFSDLGHEVYLFCNTLAEHIFKTVHYIHKSNFFKYLDKLTFDEFIYSRGVVGQKFVKTKNMSLMLHDMGPHMYRNEPCDFSKFKHIYVLSDWHKMLIHTMYNIPFSDFIKVTHNGIDLSLYDDVDVNKKTNSMVWSSCFERGLDFFAKQVFPKIKEQVPDFTLKICSYNRYNVGSLSDGIINLGSLTKQQLAEEQKKAKIWCYPNIGISDLDGRLFKETFCITAVENAAAKNCILTTKLGGLGTTCKGVNFLSDEFYNECEVIADLNKYSEYLANMCIKALLNDYFTTFDYSKYTWKDAALTLL